MVFVNWLVKLVIDYVVTKFYELVNGIRKRIQRHAVIDKEAQEAVIPLEKAETAEEIDAATDDALRKL